MTDFKVGDKVTALLRADWEGGYSEVLTKNGKVHAITEARGEMPRIYWVKFRFVSNVAPCVAEDMRPR